ncbi:MAG: endonuclease/exonuclease/phosphatase family protein [Patescibacteria group bacterium]
MKLKVISWNIWCGTHLDEVIVFLKSAEADIIALQEATEDERGNIADVIAKELGYECVHAIEMKIPLRFLPGYKSDDKGSKKFGPAILSKYKIISSQIHELSYADDFRRLVIAADIKIGSEILSIFSIHLKHTHQQPSVLQDQEVENLLGFLPAKKVIVMGDFNSLPDSSVIKKMSRTLQDAELSSATPTWSVYKEGCTGCLVESVKYKLDYIFTSRDIKINSFQVDDSTGSDHLPITAVIEK